MSTLKEHNDALTSAQIAEAVMGWPELQIGQMEPLLGYWNRYYLIEVRRQNKRGDWIGKTFDPVNNISDAFEVVEAMREKGWEFCAWTLPLSKEWEVSFNQPGPDFLIKDRDISLTRAICEVALTTLEAYKSEKENGQSKV